MWYSKRDTIDFRTDPTRNYKGGYAESIDGQSWVRKDEEFGLETAASGWDSDAIAYPYVREINGKLVMFYNGNGFGKTGFGYAEWEL